MMVVSLHQFNQLRFITFNVFKINDATNANELKDKLENPTNQSIDITLYKTVTIKLICNKIDFGKNLLSKNVTEWIIE
jgi:hypothetical protein